MKNIPIWLLAVLVAVGGFFVVKIFFSPTEKDLILQVFSEFKQKAYLSSPVSGLALVGKANSLSPFFSQDLQILYNKDDVSYKVVTNLDAFKQKALFVYQLVSQLRLENTAPKISIQKDEAQAIFTGQATWQKKSRKQKYRDSMELKVTLKKEDGDWKVFLVENLGDFLNSPEEQ